MPLPAGVTTFTLTGDELDATGAAGIPGTRGTLVPVDSTGNPVRIVHLASGTEIVPAAVTFTIAADGTWTVGPLPYTDQAGLSVVGFQYKVTWNVPAWRASPGDKQFSVPGGTTSPVLYSTVTASPTVPTVLVPVGTGPQGPTGATGATGPQGPAGTVSDATTGAKGVVQLAGDLGGTATSPTVPGLVGKLTAASNLSDVPSAATARANLGLGSAATQPTSAFDAAGAASAAVTGLAPLASPALTGSPTINGKPAKAARFHNTANPLASFTQYSSARITCGVDAALGKVWSFNTGGVYQVDALTSTAWSALTLPTNINPSGQEAKVVTYTAPSGANAGVKRMFLLSWNTVTTRYEVYSAVPGLKTVAPTWSSLLQQFPANAIMIPHAFQATSGAIFAGTYTGATDIAGGPVLYRSVDGITWTAVLSPGTTTRHCHGVYEDPFNPGTIYSTWGDYFTPYAPAFAMYKSTDSGATWTGVSTLTAGTWQAVAMGFTADYIWCLSDQSQGWGPYLLDRATMTPKWATTKGRQDNIAVPMGIGGRQVADAVFNSTTTVTSATAAFTSADVGRAVMGNNSIPIGAYIQAFVSATQVTLSAAATSTQSSQPIVIGGDQFYGVAYTGAVDPASGWLYLVANDSSNFGNVAGIFVLTGPDEPITLLRTLPLASIGHHETFIGGGYLWIDRYGPMPLFTAV